MNRVNSVFAMPIVHLGPARQDDYLGLYSWQQDIRNRHVVLRSVIKMLSLVFSGAMGRKGFEFTSWWILWQSFFEKFAYLLQVLQVFWLFAIAFESSAILLKSVDMVEEERRRKDNCVILPPFYKLLILARRKIHFPHEIESTTMVWSLRVFL